MFVMCILTNVHFNFSRLFEWEHLGIVYFFLQVVPINWGQIENIYVR